MTKLRPIFFAAILIGAPLAAQNEKPPFTIQESGKSFWRLDDAVRTIGDGEGTILISPGTYHDCASQRGGQITYKAVTPGAAIFDGGICEGKAALVLGGDFARVEGLVFQNMKVADGNGAGIRQEHGDLEVVNSMFRNSEEGILTAPDPTGHITIDRSTFSGLGRCDRGLSCAHSIYVGDYGSLTVTHTRFEKGRGGHYLKSNSGRNIIADNSFDDTGGKDTNYMIDLPAGSIGSITGNVFVQGKGKENHSALITVGAETRSHSSAGLVISGNKASLAPGVSWSTVFVADFSHEPLKISGNALGAGIQAFETR
jgi:Right handed beta helix region